MKAFIFAETDESAAGLAFGARSLGADTVTQIVLGTPSAACSGADVIAWVPVPATNAYEDAYDSIAAYFEAQEPQLVLSEPTRRLKVIVGKLAAKCGASLITGIEKFNGDEVVASYFAGLAQRQSKTVSAVKFYSVDQGVFTSEGAACPSATQEEIAWVSPTLPIEVLERNDIEKSDVDLHGSDVVISCGRGFGEQSELGLAFDLAAKLGAAVGCTRPLTEGMDWFPHEAYIGVSGQTVSPKVYIAAGVSGQMQHMVGAKNAGKIIAINKDKNAPIFKQCDLGIIGDIKQVLPLLTEKL